MIQMASRDNKMREFQHVRRKLALTYPSVTITIQVRRIKGTKTKRVEAEFMCTPRDDDKDLDIQLKSLNGFADNLVKLDISGKSRSTHARILNPPPASFRLAA